VNLQNPYFYIPLNQKRQFSNKNDSIGKYVKDKDEFYSHLQNKFGDSGSTPRKPAGVYKTKK
jgi:hypothetical protein